MARGCRNKQGKPAKLTIEVWGKGGTWQWTEVGVSWTLGVICQVLRHSLPLLQMTDLALRGGGCSPCLS